ncbi:MAG TPA: RNA polymerase sigma factor [Rugosimonospora sp.]|nr:RNA polymerase sigma factor [Rugosimonospora sp.]
MVTNDNTTSAAGRKTDFEEFYLRCYPDLVRYIVRLGATPEDADDIAQVCMIHALREWDRIQDPFRWIYTVARRATWRTAERTFKTVELDEQEPALVVHDQAQNAALASELNAAIERALDDMSPRSREVWVMWYALDLSTDEIAQILGLSPSTVRTLLQRARIRLRERLRSEHGIVAP